MDLKKGYDTCKGKKCMIYMEEEKLNVDRIFFKYF